MSKKDETIASGFCEKCSNYFLRKELEGFLENMRRRYTEE